MFPYLQMALNAVKTTNRDYWFDNNEWVWINQTLLLGIRMKWLVSFTSGIDQAIVQCTYKLVDYNEVFNGQSIISICCFYSI
jgi:hypothetical protein